MMGRVEEKFPEIAGGLGAGVGALVSLCFFFMESADSAEPTQHNSTSRNLGIVKQREDFFRVPGGLYGSGLRACTPSPQ